MTSSEYLFVYGTLRKHANHPMSDLLQKHSRKIGSATFQGKLFDAGSFPAAVSTDRKSQKVYGELYKLNDPDSLFAHLDTYEGYDPQHKAKSLFVRDTAIVRSSEKEFEAWIYLYNRPVNTLPPIPEGDYLSYLNK